MAIKVRWWRCADFYAASMRNYTWQDFWKTEYDHGKYSQGKNITRFTFPCHIFLAISSFHSPFYIIFTLHLIYLSSFPSFLLHSPSSHLLGVVSPLSLIPFFLIFSSRHAIPLISLSIQLLTLSHVSSISNSFLLGFSSSPKYVLPYSATPPRLLLFPPFSGFFSTKLLPLAWPP